MKHLFLALAALSIAVSAPAATLQINVSNFVGQATVRKIYLEPTSDVAVGGAGFAAGPKMPYTPTNNAVTVSNLFPCGYWMTFEGLTTKIGLLVPDTNGVVNAASIVTVGTNMVSSGTVAYSAAASDARYAMKGEAGTLPDNVITNDYAGQIRAEEFIGAIQASNIVGLVASDSSVNTLLAPGGGTLQFVGPFGSNIVGQVHPNTVALLTNWPANAGTNGFSTWMVFTSSTNYQWAGSMGASYEDPFVYASRDGGATWVPRGRQPLFTRNEMAAIAGWPTNAWQADTELYLAPDGVMLMLWAGFYQLNSSNFTSKLFTSQSTNGTDWSTPVVMRTSVVQSNATWAGPEIVVTSSNTLRLYFVDENYATNALIYVRGNDLSGTNWNWGETNFCTLNPYLTNTLAPWHMSMKWRAGKYHLIYGSQSNSQQEYTTSADGITWDAPGIGFVPMASLTNFGGNYYSTYKCDFWPSTKSESAWNVIVGLNPVDGLAVSGFGFKLLRDFEPQPSTWSYTGANTNNWTLVGARDAYIGISRPAALTVFEAVGPGDNASFSIGYHSAGYAGFQAGTAPLKGSSTYALRSGGGYTILNAASGSDGRFRIAEIGVGGWDSTGIYAAATKSFWGGGWGLTNIPPSAITGVLSAAQITLPAGILTNSYTGQISASSFAGNGGPLTNITPSAITGRLASAQMALTPTFSSITTTGLSVLNVDGTSRLTMASDSPGVTDTSGLWRNNGTNAALVFQGDASGLTNGNATTLLSSGTVSASRLPATNTVTTSVGALTLTGPLTLASQTNGAVSLGTSVGIASADFANSVNLGSHAVRLSTNFAGAVNVGYSAGYQSTNFQNAVNVGFTAGYLCMAFANSVNLGNAACYLSSNFAGAVNLGVNAGYLATNFQNAVNVGNAAGRGLSGAINSINIGRNSGTNRANTIWMDTMSTAPGGSYLPLLLGYCDTRQMLVNGALSASNVVTASGTTYRSNALPTLASIGASSLWVGYHTNKMMYIWTDDSTNGTYSLTPP